MPSKRHTFIFLGAVVYDGDDLTIYDVDRRIDDWFVLLMPSLNNHTVKKKILDCGLATTHWDGRQVELKPMHGTAFARYGGQPGILVGPPKNGMVFVEVDVWKNLIRG